MVDALVSGTSKRKLVEVRVFSWAPRIVTFFLSHRLNILPCHSPHHDVHLGIAQGLTVLLKAL